MTKLIKFETKQQRRARRAQEVRLAIIAALSVFVIGIVGWQYLSPSPDAEASQDTSSTESPSPRQAFFSASDDPDQPSFDLCEGAIRTNCVVDGDTIWLRGTKIRIADIDTPEVSDPQCEDEYQLGMEATYRLRELLNDGPFSVEPIGSRDEDQYGRKLRVLTREGQSIGDMLINEDLARTWTGRREPWC